MADDLLVDPEALREQVREKYREVAVDPHRSYHFHTGRPLAARLGYDPDRRRRSARPGRRVLRRCRQSLLAPPPATRRTGCRRRLRCGIRLFIAAAQVGATGRVIGRRHDHRRCSTSHARPPSALGFAHVEFREGLAEAICPSTTVGPTPSSPTASSTSAPTNKPCSPRSAGCCDPGGWLQFADIANGRPVPPEALRDIDLWTG